MKPMMTVVVVASAGILVLTGCKKASEKISEKIIEQAIERDSGGKASVDIQEGKVTIKTKDGLVEASSGVGAKIPDGFPQDVYVVKGAKVAMSMKTPEGFQLLLETKDGLDKTAGAYASEMKTLGWTEETNVNMGESVMVSYKKGKRQAMVVITKGSSGAQVQLTAMAGE